jgi:N-acetylmuramoyl-L-alanine amidase
VCLDAGHGQDNRKPGIFDPGCERKGRQEAMLAWNWLVELRAQLAKAGVPTMQTRKVFPESCPLASRAKLAKREGATHFISIHVNDSTPSGTGTETLIESKFSKPFAALIHRALVDTLDLRDRGIKFRDDLAVLKTGMPSVLIELGFIETDWDVINDSAVMRRTCAALAAAILQA